jgi:DNA polymerase-4
MRAADRIGRTVVLRLRFADFTRATRSHTLPGPTAHTQTILTTVRALFAEADALIAGKGLTLVGIAVGNLNNGDAVQLELPLFAHSGGELDDAVDRVRDRFGSTALTRAVNLGRDPGLTVPMLPD